MSVYIYSVLLRKFEGDQFKYLLGRTEYQNDSKKETGCVRVRIILTTQEKDQRRALVNAEMTFSVK